jgi:hypothetical protein
MVTKRFVLSVGHLSRFAAIVVLGLAAVANAKAVEATYAQRMACTPDAFRLCSSHIPDADAVRICMIANKAKLSAACLATFPRDVVTR